MNVKHRSLLEIHLAVFLFGLSGLFGKILALPAMIIVLGRAFFASAFLFILLLSFKKTIKLEQQKDYVFMLLIGMLLAIHWSTFFLSIQMSTVAIGLLTFSTFPLFVTFIEPYFFKEKILLSDIITVFVTFLGVILVIPEFEVGNHLTQGVLWGITSGFTYALLSILNRKYVGKYSSTVVAFYGQLNAAILLIPFLFLQKPIFQTNDILLLLVLGLIFTGISHTLFINGLRNIKTQTAGIISCLEPLYGIIFAAFLLGEIPTLKELAGGSVILAAVLYSTIKSK